MSNPFCNNNWLIPKCFRSYCSGYKSIPYPSDVGEETI